MGGAVLRRWVGILFTAVGRAMNAVAWGIAAGGAAVALAAVYVALLLRGIENERVISSAIAAMVAAKNATDTAPQRALLRSVASTLLAQERAAARIKVTVQESSLPGHRVPEAEELLKEILGLPEPQLLIADFLSKYGGGPGAEVAFDAFAARLLSAATAEVYADLDLEDEIALNKLLLLAMDGRIEPVALAGFEVCGFPRQAHVSRMADVAPEVMACVVSVLDQATRRQLRLATLLHGQAEAILRLRGQADQRERRTAWLRVRRLLAAPRLRLQRPRFQPDDLAALEVVFDAVGEAVDTATEYLHSNEPASAMYMLTGVQVPVPGGLPGRIYNQDALSQVRPLAALGVRHRLAVCRWGAASLNEIAQGHGWAPGPDTGDEGGAQ